VVSNSWCGKAGDIGSLSNRPIVRNVLGGDRANPGAWPWHAVISMFNPNVVLVRLFLIYSSLFVYCIKTI